MPTFWTGGRRALERGLRDQYQARTAELRVAMKQAASEEQRDEIESQIAALERELKARIKQCERSLF